MEIIVHIPSIDNLAKAIEALAAVKNCTCTNQEVFPAMVNGETALVEINPVPILETPAPAPAPVQAVTYTRQQLAVAATGLVDAGKKAELLNLLADFHIKSMTELQEESFGTFATALRGLGAAI